MRSVTIICLLSIIGFSGFEPVCLAQDWPQWRGSQRTGATDEGPALIDSIPKEGLKSRIVWKSEPMPDQAFMDNRFGNLGFSTPIVANGRVYLYLNKKIADDQPVRFNWGLLNRLGCFDSQLPPDLAKSIEAARTSEERKSLPSQKVSAWAREWVTSNLSYEQYLTFGVQAENRLIGGSNALSLEMLAKLTELKGKPFSSEAELKATLREIGLDAALKDVVVKNLFADRKRALDLIYCIDLETGKTLWKKSYSGTVYDYGTSSTPCIVDNKLYVIGGSKIYCLEAATGEEVWQVPCPSKEVSSSPVVEKGVIVIQAGSLCALDAKTGKSLWGRDEFQGTHASPTIWRKDGKSYVIQDQGMVDLETGHLIWKQGSSFGSSPVVADDILVVDLGKSQIGGFRLTPNGGQLIWTLKVGGIGIKPSTPIIYKGHIFVTISQTGPLVCVELATGTLKWESPPKSGCVTSAFNTQSCILVDGKVFIDGGKSHGVSDLMMIRASPDAFEMLLKDSLVEGNYRTSTPTIADGRLLIRGTDALVCYDLRKEDFRATGNQKKTVEEKTSQPVSRGGQEGEQKTYDSGHISVKKEPAPSREEWEQSWPYFRGAGGGFVRKGIAPLKWDVSSGKNVIWKTALTRPGISSPVAWGNRIYLTSADKKARVVSAYDAKSGKLIWEKTADKIEGSPEDIPEVMDDTGLAASSPATDGKRVFAIFATGDLICFSKDGNREWAKSIGVPANHYGYASSLLVCGDLLIVQYDGAENNRILAFDAATGKSVWECPTKSTISWATPILINSGKRDELLVTSSSLVSSISPQDGKVLWSMTCMTGEVASSPAYSNGLAYFMNKGADAVAVDTATGKVRWKKNDLDAPEVSSPVAAGKYLFWGTTSGSVIAMETETGKVAWKWKADDGFYSSPVVVNNLLYITDKTGNTYVFKTSGVLEEPTVNALKEPVVATPAFMEGQIYIRGKEHLFCIGE